MRRAARTDKNHLQIVVAFRTLGAAVVSLASLGRGIPDLLVSVRGVTWLVEVKTPTGKETPDQVRFAAAWQGCRAIVRDEESVMRTVEMMREQSVRIGYTSSTDAANNNKSEDKT